MLRVLINAYAVCPNMGSEPGMAWNWCVNLAKYCQLEIITEGEFRDKIEAVVPTLPQRKNMHFHYNPVSDEIRRICWNQGDWRFYWYYRNWQLKTYQIAKEICNSHPVDILHQFNMIGFREPGYLWKLSKETGISFVWGPIGGMGMAPLNYMKDLSLKQRLKARLKNVVNDWQRKHSPRVCKAINQATAIIAANSDSYKILHGYHNKGNVTLINEAGCPPSENNGTHNFQRDKLHLLWVGRFLLTKKLDLALDIIHELRDLPIHLDIIGTGNDKDVAHYKTDADRQGLNTMITWHGQQPHSEVLHIMSESDLFLFTSILEGTPNVVLESIANGLPVLCFDTCGQGDVVNDKVGIKIPLTNPNQSVKDFADCIRQLYNDRSKLVRLSEGCMALASQLSWNNKAKQMLEIYHEAQPHH